MKNETVRFNIPSLKIHAHRANRFLKPGACCEPHFHNELEFLPVYSGEFICIVNGREYRAKEGEILFINSRIPHYTRNELDNTRTGLLQFCDYDFLNNENTRIIRYSLRLQSLSEEPVHILKSKELFDTIDELFNEKINQGCAYEIMIHSLALKIIAILYKEGILSDGVQVYSNSSVQKILPALSYINENYKQDITLGDVSELLGFERSYFCRMFKSAIGSTFTEYLNFVRVSKAEKLLSEGNLSVMEISNEVGFSSVSYFNRIFKKYKNCSPSYYKTVKFCNNM